MPKRKRPTVVKVPLTHAIEMYHRGFAENSTGEVKLTPAGKKKLGNAGWRSSREGIERPQ